MREQQLIDGIPRRIRLDHNTKIELDIRNIVHEVERLGADEKLTHAINKLHEARELIADYIESHTTHDKGKEVDNG